MLKIIFYLINFLHNILINKFRKFALLNILIKKHCTNYFNKFLFQLINILQIFQLINSLHNILINLYFI